MLGERNLDKKQKCKQVDLTACKHKQKAKRLGHTGVAATSPAAIWASISAASIQPSPLAECAAGRRIQQCVAMLEWDQAGYACSADASGPWAAATAVACDPLRALTMLGAAGGAISALSGILHSVSRHNGSNSGPAVL